MAAQVSCLDEIIHSFKDLKQLVFFAEHNGLCNNARVMRHHNQLAAEETFCLMLQNFDHAL